MKFKIKNSFVLGLASWLSELNLEGKFSRARTRFTRQLAERHKEVDGFRIELIEKYAEKDADGNKKVVDGSYVIPEKDKLMAELEELFAEEFTVELDKNEAAYLKDIVLNTNYKFGPKEDDNEQEKQAKIRQANDYDEWCKAFEATSKK